MSPRNEMRIIISCDRNRVIFLCHVCGAALEPLRSGTNAKTGETFIRMACTEGHCEVRIDFNGYGRRT